MTESFVVLRPREYIREIIDPIPGSVLGIEANERAVYSDGAIYVIAKRRRRWFRR